MNRRAKYDSASFMLGGEIRKRTNTQTVTDISTPCLSACVDNNPNPNPHFDPSPHRICVFCSVLRYSDRPRKSDDTERNGPACGTSAIFIHDTSFFGCRICKYWRFARFRPSSSTTRCGRCRRRPLHLPHQLTFHSPASCRQSVCGSVIAASTLHGVVWLWFFAYFFIRIRRHSRNVLLQTNGVSHQ